VVQPVWAHRISAVCDGGEDDDAHVNPPDCSLSSPPVGEAGRGVSGAGQSLDVSAGSSVAGAPRLVRGWSARGPRNVEKRRDRTRISE
jgi:hypothetical protein